jgi:histidine-containing phosphotransfer protein
LENNNIPLLAESQLEQLRGNGQEAAFKEIISMYLAQTHEQLSHLKSAITKEKFKTIGAIAHQIKGSSANLGAARLSDECSCLEGSALTENLNESIALMEKIQGTFSQTEVQFRALLNE